MCESFGARLRQRREEQQITLSAIADQTKIKLSLLEGLERDDVARWPSGIFRRAFIRAYAHAIGLQPDVIVREFLDVYPDPLEEITAAAVAEAVEAASMSAGPPTRLRYLVGAAVGSLSRLRPGSGQRRIAEAEDRPQPVASLDPHLPELPELSEPFEPLEDVAIQAPEIPDRFEMAAALETVEPVAAAAAEDPAAEVPVVIEEAVPEPAPVEPDLATAAYLCAELSQIDEIGEVSPLLDELSRVIDALGLIVWIWDPQIAALTPALPYGYSDEVLAQLPNLPRDARNATAAAFRSARTCSVSGGEGASDGLVVPLMTRAGCTGVLAIELQPGGAGRESIRSLATIFAAQMARVVGDARPVAAANRRLA